MPVPEISKMYQLRPNISLRQIAIAAAIAVVASFAIYYVFDVLPQSFRSDDSGLTEVEIKSRLERTLQQIAGYENAGATEVNFDGYVISWQQTFDKSVCDDPNTYYSRTVTIDLRNIETRPDRVRVRRYDNEGWVMLIWKYEKDYEKLLQRMNEKQDEILARIKSDRASGVGAEAKTPNALMAEFGEELKNGGRSYMNCTGENSIEPLRTFQFTLVTRPEMSEEIVALFNAYKMRVGAK